MNGTVTAKEVARKAKVSVGTVSRVFNNHNNVSEDIRQHVLKVAADLGYFRSSGSPVSARASSRSLKEVGFFYCSSIEEVPATNDPYWAPIFFGVESASRQSNIKIIYRTISDMRHTPHLLTTLLYDMHLGGVLLVGQANAALINIIKATKTPVVQVDNYVPELANAIDTLLPDNFQGGNLAMEQLFNAGHRHIAFIGGPSDSAPRPTYKIYSIQQRWVSYCMALLDRGLMIDYDLVESGSLTLESGYDACKRLLEQKTDFSAIFCVDDITAIGAMKALREEGLRVPEDVSIIGFDGIDLGQHVTPALSTIRVNKEDLGALALKTLLDRASNPEAPCVTTLLGVEFLQRNSIAAPNPAIHG